uniref:olfactomedin-like protein 3 n=1 Tax=Myxine glutinosa TaxID=7769 RepID=UPI00358F716E
MVSRRVLVHLAIVWTMFLYEATGQRRPDRDTMYKEYMERRVGTLEEKLERMSMQLAYYERDLNNMKKESERRLSILTQDKTFTTDQLDSLSLRVERVERDVDYFETQNPSKHCIEGLTDENLDTDEDPRGQGSMTIHECNHMLASIRSLKIVKRSGGDLGAWFHGDHGGDNFAIYVLPGAQGTSLLRYPSLSVFAATNLSDVHDSEALLTLPAPYQGTGHALLGDYLYYHRAGSENEIVKVDLVKGTLVDRALLPGTGLVPPFALNPDTRIQLATDEVGLWAIHAGTEASTISLSKLDAHSLAVEQTWNTGCHKEGAEAGFVLCGALYIVYNTRRGGRSRVQCIFDVSQKVSPENLPLVYFPRRFGSLASLSYTPNSPKFTAWDDGYQMLYRLALRNKQ